MTERPPKETGVPVEVATPFDVKVDFACDTSLVPLIDINEIPEYDSTDENDLMEEDEVAEMEVRVCVGDVALSTTVAAVVFSAKFPDTALLLKVALLLVTA